MRTPTRRRRTLKAVVVVTLSALLGAAGCVADPPTTPVGGGYSPPSTLVGESHDRAVKQAMVRFRVNQCGAIVLGSGFAISSDTILTNRHVIQGETKVEVSTWDGVDLHVTSVQASPSADLAVVKVSEKLDATIPLAAEDPYGREPVDVVGYPKGEALHVAKGKVLEIMPGEDYGEKSVLLMDNVVEHGNSGGPLVNVNGEVVGLVFAYIVGSKTGVAIPVSVVREVLDDKDLLPPPSCLELQ